MTNHDPHVQELLTLKIIAETLNQSNDLTLMLGTVLEKLLELTGLQAGWIFLTDRRMNYERVADRGLPPGLLHDNKAPMCSGTCWCLDRFWDNRLNNAVNILNCKRLEDAVSRGWGDTQGITHHATVPLRSGDRKFGVLNVASPFKTHFSNEELALLQAVAFQIGSAVDRMRLYAAERRRAELFARLGDYSRSLGMAVSAGTEPGRLSELALRLVGEHFEWPFAALLETTGDELILQAVHAQGRTTLPYARLPLQAANWLREAARARRPAVATPEQASELAGRRELRGLAPARLSIAQAVPIPLAGLAPGSMLVIGNDAMGRAEEPVDNEVLEALAEHIAMAFESARLEEHRRELARLAERNRLARDLHDSVCQMLFSLSMTAKGVESLLKGSQPDAALQSVGDMQALSQSALKEMRALIMQLRPAGLEAGLVTALQVYGEKLKLRVHAEVTDVCELPRHVEEALWRIGQEALNNVSKHAGTADAMVSLRIEARQAVLKIADQGRGIAKKKRPAEGAPSFGMATMRERAEALGGRFALASVYRGGTTVEAAIPLPANE
ncbi:GAF domain-containing protein [Paenibacillus sacheonensis]|uniref:histidine kinase n=2 Tax=Paenibacillus sacheonensis TaxID=742054 RepID=A0A7X5BXT9_9BACL|nr:GAF domain-containing sensor histidine kinase [Paenibacillus sacheonensis]NBC70863.1 GAF domain-containing protein [Paenibacillus sacheonensis]